jgi:hypothetical protein
MPLAHRYRLADPQRQQFLDVPNETKNLEVVGQLVDRFSDCDKARSKATPSSLIRVGLLT